MKIKEETLAAIIGAIVFFTIYFIGYFSMNEPTEPRRATTRNDDPSRDYLSTGQNIDIPDTPVTIYTPGWDEYWEVEHTNGHYYLVPREDRDPDLNGYLDNDEELLLR